MTEQAVLNFQKKYGLVQDGMVGPETMEIIDKLLTSNTTTTTTTQPATNTNEIYRVRTSWNNINSQIGAFKDLNNAIAICKKAGANYSVFNSAGKAVYPTSSGEQTSTTPTTTAPTTVTQATKYSNVVLGSSSKDENGEYRGGQAGDQTGKEVWILNWYDGGWNYVIRPKSAALAEKIAAACEKACNNNNIGYDQNQRNTLLTEAKKVGLDMSKISTPCECDCASLVSTCCVCAGLPEGTFFAGGNGRTTYNLLSACESTGQFTTLSGTNYTKSKDFLKRGDILLASGHTVIVLENGSKANQIATVTVVAETYKIRVTAEKKLNVRSGPSTNYAIVTQIVNGGIFTIVEEKEGWGRLKSGAGWIDLSYTQRI